MASTFAPSSIACASSPIYQLEKLHGTEAPETGERAARRGGQHHGFTDHNGQRGVEAFAADHSGPGQLRGRRIDDAKSLRLRSVQPDGSRGSDVPRRSCLRLLSSAGERAEAPARAVARGRAVLEDV